MRLTAAPGAGRRPSPPRRFSLCPFLLCSATYLTLAHSAAHSRGLDAPHLEGFLNTWWLTHIVNRGTELPAPCAGGLLCWGWLGGILPCHRDCLFLAGGSCLCRTPLDSLLSQLPFLSSLRQPCPGSPLSSWSPFPQQGQPHPQPHWPHLGLPQLQPQLGPIGNRGHCQSPTAPQPLPCTCPQPGALHPGAANTARGTEEAGKLYSLRHIRNPRSELATRLSAQRQQDRGRKGKRKEEEGQRDIEVWEREARKWDAANKRGTRSRTTE